MGKRIDIIVGNNSYSSVAHFSSAISSAFQRVGCQTKLFFVGNDRFYQAFYEILNDPPDFTFSFSNVTLGGSSLSAKWGIPHFSYLLDPAIYYMHQLDGKGSMVSCVDRKDVSLMLANKNPLNENAPLFLPHGIDRKLFKTNKGDALYDIVMVGTCHDFEKIRKSWAEKFSPEVKKLLEAAVDLVLSPAGISCYEAIEKLCGHIHEMKPHMITLHRELDIYITGKERVDLIQSLKGQSVHIFGKGPWQKYAPEAVVHPQVPFSKTLKIFNASKIVLNSSPRFKEGSHERVFTSFAKHSLCLSGVNPYFQEHFEDEKSILFYSYGDYQGLNEKVGYYLAHDKKREEIIEQGRAITLSDHTWDSRVQVILKTIK